MRSERGYRQYWVFVGVCGFGVAIGLALLLNKAHGPIAGWLSLPFGFFLGATSGVGLGALQVAIRLQRSQENDHQ